MLSKKVRTSHILLELEKNRSYFLRIFPYEFWQRVLFCIPTQNAYELKMEVCMYIFSTISSNRKLVFEIQQKTAWENSKYGNSTGIAKFAKK